MQIKEFYIVPENKLDETFIDDEMSFLIDVSIRQRDKFTSVSEYIDKINNRYDLWLDKQDTYEQC